MAKGKQKSLFKELDEIIAVLRSGKTQDLVILIIPSHDRLQQELTDQDMWAGTALVSCLAIFGQSSCLN